MLSSLFRPKWQHKDSAIRQQAVLALSYPNDKSLLISIAKNDESEPVRRLAISKINHLQSLYQLHHETHFKQDKSYLQQCWCAVLANSDLTPPLQAENYVLDCRDKSWLAAIVCYCENASLQELALTGLRNEETIFELLEQSSISRLWPALVQQLKTEEALKKALTLTKGRDKKTTQQIKQNLDSLAQEKQLQEQQLQHAEQVLQKLQQVLNSEQTPLLEGILLNFQQQIAEIPSDNCLFNDINNLLSQCQAKLQQQIQAEKEQAQQAKQLNQAKQLLTKLSHTLQKDQTFERALDELKQLPKTPTLQAALHEISQLEQAIEQFNTQLSQIDACQNSDEKLSLISQAIVLCQSQHALKAHHLDSLQQQQSQLRGQQKQLDKQHKHDSHSLDALIKQADDAIADNDFNQLQTLYKKIKPLLTTLDKAQQHHYQAASTRIQAATQAAYDWKKYALEPKRQELCQAMQNLVGSTHNAVDQAEAIKQLQNQWKALGYCHNQDLWQQFHQLSEQAYAPCKAYFAKQHEIKQFNAQQKETICQHLEQLIAGLDWTQADFVSLDKLCQKIDQEWRKYSPVNHHDHSRLQNRFNDLMQQLKTPISQEKKRNGHALQQLVDKARQLNDISDVQEALNQYQQLHDAWKTVGLCYYKEQQSLWQALKDAGNVLYEKRNLQRQESEEAQAQNLQQALSLIEQAKNAEHAETLTQLQIAFDQLGNLPKQQNKKVRADFASAVKQFDKQQQQKQQQQAFKQLDIISDWGTLCEEQEQNGQTASAALPDTLDNTSKETLSQRFNKVADASHLLNWVIKAELLAQLPSPEADNALRMQIQMQLLTEHFNHANSGDLLTQLREYYLQFFALPSQVENYSALRTRFLNAAKALIK